jgi:cytochrome c-type biogenesis protein CcmH
MVSFLAKFSLTAFLITFGLAWVILVGQVNSASAQVVTPAPVENTTYAAQVFSIADQLQCPVCQGQTVAYSNSGLAQQMRTLIAKKLEEGASREQVLTYFVERYGDGILTTPPRSGFTLLVWVLPFVGLLVGTGIVGLALRKFRQARPGGPSPKVQPAPPSVVPSESGMSRKDYEARVEEEIAQLSGTGSGLHSVGNSNSTKETK